MPRAPAVSDYLTGSASLFQDDMARDRALLEQVLDCILIYASGAIVVKFKEATLLEPVNTYRLKNLGAEPPALPEARALQEQGVAMVKETLRCFRPEEDPKDVDFMVNEDANGSPWVMAMKNARLIEERGVVNKVGVPTAPQVRTNAPAWLSSSLGGNRGDLTRLSLPV